MTDRPEPLDRRETVTRLLRDRGDLLLVTGLGSTTWDAAAAGDDDRNFYLWGAMGGAAMMGLGLALAQPTLPVCVLTGDGETLMGLGGLASVGMQNPPNLTIVVLDNERYGETGMQASHTARAADLARIASGCGIAQTLRVEDEAGVDDLRELMLECAGCLFAAIKVRAETPTRVLPSRDGVYLKNRFRRAVLGG